MMEVYEVMLFAFPLWLGLVVTIFMMVFGRDVISFFSKLGQNPVARVKPSIRPATEAPDGVHYGETVEHMGERELALR